MAAKADLVLAIAVTPSNSCTQLPPRRASPQVTTDPSPRMAAKAQSVAWMCLTSRSRCWTARLSPSRPQVTTNPSPKMAAQELELVWICCTFQCVLHPKLRRSIRCGTYLDPRMHFDSVGYLVFWSPRIRTRGKPTTPKNAQTNLGFFAGSSWQMKRTAFLEYALRGIHTCSSL